MRVFTDGKNREWELEITVDSARRIKEQLEFDIVALKDGEALTNLLNDPVKIVDTLWLLLEEQANEAGIDSSKFSRGFFGDALERATDALVSCMIDFFPGKRRAILQKMWSQAKAIQEREIEAVSKYLDSPQLEKDVEKFLKTRMQGLTSPPAA
ncbi:MAG: hypothetical protein KDA84_25930 [Planctomycetaceae bacterium]|nr:hypothetical protein [Planctomycetaceae bacterium]